MLADHTDIATHDAMTCEHGYFVHQASLDTKSYKSVHINMECY